MSSVGFTVVKILCFPISVVLFKFKDVLKCCLVPAVLWWFGKSNFAIGNYVFPEVSYVQAVVISIILFVSTHPKFLWLLYKTTDRDLRALKRYIVIRFCIWRIQSQNMTVPKLFQKNVSKNPNKACLIFEGAEWSFSKMDEYSNRVANFLDSQGHHKGDSIALVMENRPEFVATWLGCAKVGIVPALINFNLRQATLVHSIKIVDSKAVICGAEMQSAIMDIEGDLKGIPIFVSGLQGGEPNKGFRNMDKALSTAIPTSPLQINELNFSDNLLYIYTSGTTGMPKAAIIKHSRYCFFSTAVHFMLDIEESEVIYNPLPLYHTAGGLVGMGQVLIFNCTAVIRKKFSASNYWIEANKYGCTVAQYVGEICRYLLNTPPRPEDKQHKVRVMFGNGVRAQIWEEFTERFSMPLIGEFYGATESNANIVNFEGKPGACGFLSVVAPWVYPVTLMKVDEITGEPIRDRNGLCMRCEPGEPGEFVGKIRKNDPINDFHGYADKKATEKKIIRNVFSQGDFGFVSGDILVMDEFGYVYFKDRLGDTFRWRGENVSTTEVEGVVSQVANNRDAVVYGVEVPGTEGKAGMAAIVDPEGNLDIDEFTKSIEKYLPVYARPLFVRVLDEIDTTGTFKLKKGALQKQGFNLTNITDKMFFLDYRNRQYVPLTKDLYEKINDAKAGL